MSKGPLSIAATSTLAMVSAATARGVECSDLLGAAGLTREFLEHPDARIPAPTVLGLWAALRERTGDPTLQLTAPTSLPYGAYRIIEYLIAASATVGDAVRRFAEFFGLIADSMALTIDRVDDVYSLTLATAMGGPVPPVYVDYAFAALVGRVRMRIRPGLCVLRVEFRQPEPPSSAAYRDLFGAPVVFGAAQDRLFFTAQEWNTAIASADAALAQMLEHHARILARRIPQTAPSFSAEVQKTIADTPSRSGSAESVARSLNMSVRTLQRKLVDDGTTFRAVSDAVRWQLAEDYLNDPKVSIAEVAFLLGFSDQSSFNRAFRRWTGKSPGRWRRTRP